MKQYKYFSIIVALYVAVQLTSAISAGKIIDLFSFPVSAATLFFPLAFIFSDIITEIYGYAYGRTVVWLIFFTTVLSALLFQLVVYLPPAAGFVGNEAYMSVLGSLPRIMLGSWIAIWVGGMLNDYVLAKMKVWSKGKYLWSRTIGSTIAGQLADSILFFTIALYGVLPNDLLIKTILSAWIVKVLVEVVLTPVTYIVIAKLKKAENEDHYDRNTDFNPLIIAPTGDK